MHLLIVYDNPQHRFIKNMVVTVNADGTPPTQTPNSAKGALVFDVPDGAQTLTTDGSELVVGAAGKIFASPLASLAFNGWTSVTAGSDPVYPG